MVAEIATRFAPNEWTDVLRVLPRSTFETLARKTGMSWSCYSSKTIAFLHVIQQRHFLLFLFIKKKDPNKKKKPKLMFQAAQNALFASETQALRPLQNITVSPIVWAMPAWSGQSQLQPLATPTLSFAATQRLVARPYLGLI